ncbi:S24 family peptidase [uncultured Roseovarius sp.]|uniref:S24 family peptidase n=1 Tax=uncultured Roseovarius sp. TaxID=293344 RepID=UPI000C6022E7|nr:hypothetical protein [Roseovarius sp.]MBD12817.1 hypothetical protein [Roseovarius sp.]|tara:strand:- start:682 stop:1350 length:669 start_codon:yes stop_codon:yes gene_type:complete
MTRFGAHIEEQPLFSMIRAGIEEKGLRPYARELGVPVGVLRSVQAGRDAPYSSLKALSEALGLDFYIGPPREAAPVYTPQVGHDDFDVILRLDARLAAGAGVENGEVSYEGALAFCRKWLNEHNISPSQACLMRVSGDSMCPMLRDDDVVMIDQRKTTIRNRHVYALVDIDGSSRVKRVELVDNEMIILSSDNPDYPTETRRGPDMNRIRILGEIVWSSHAW